MRTSKLVPAEGVGFEPTRHTPTGFQGQHHRPLGQPSRTNTVTTLVHRPEDCATRELLPSGLVPLRPPGSASDALLRLRPEACRTRTVGRSESRCVTVAGFEPDHSGSLPGRPYLQYPRVERVARQRRNTRRFHEPPISGSAVEHNVRFRNTKPWRSERDLNPRYPCGYTTFPGWRTRPDYATAPSSDFFGRLNGRCLRCQTRGGSPTGTCR